MKVTDLSTPEQIIWLLVAVGTFGLYVIFVVLVLTGFLYPRS